jgi:hypothetical protein
MALCVRDGKHLHDGRVLLIEGVVHREQQVSMGSHNKSGRWEWDSRHEERGLRIAKIVHPGERW